MEFGNEFANAVANATMGWYSNSLTDAQLVEEIESALRRFGHAELVLPEEIVAEILTSRAAAGRG